MPVRFGVREWIALGAAVVTAIVGWRSHDATLKAIRSDTDALVESDMSQEKRIATIEAGRFTSDDARRMEERVEATERALVRVETLLAGQDDQLERLTDQIGRLVGSITKIERAIPIRDGSD